MLHELGYKKRIHINACDRISKRLYMFYKLDIERGYIIMLNVVCVTLVDMLDILFICMYIS